VHGTLEDWQEASATPAPLQPNYRLTRLAEALAGAARPLLPSAMFLSVTRTPGLLHIHWWGPAFVPAMEITAAPDAFCPADSAEGRLQRTGSAFIDWLEGRWPAGAAPAELGVITDGRGVVFAPSRPAPAAPGWMQHHALNGEGLRAILPMEPTGPCALLAGPGTRSFEALH